jgi:hypothetical protein
VVSQVGSPFQVKLQIALNGVGAEEVSVFRKAFFQSIKQKWAKRSAEPLVRGNIEADFLAIKNRWRKFVLHQFLKQQFLARAAHFQFVGQGGGKLDDAMVEKWRPHLDGMGHAHAIRLHQNVIGQIVVLIEREVRV